MPNREFIKGCLWMIEEFGKEIENAGSEKEKEKYKKIRQLVIEKMLENNQPRR